VKRDPSKSYYIPRAKRARAGKSARFREQVLRDWLGCDEPYDLNDGVTSADIMMEDILEKMGLSQGINEEELKKSWGNVKAPLLKRLQDELGADTVRDVRFILG